jgi:hypothetical protein
MATCIVLGVDASRLGIERDDAASQSQKIRSSGFKGRYLSTEETCPRVWAILSISDT